MNQTTATEPFLLDALQQGAQQLAQVGLPMPRLDSELLLAHALGLDRPRLLAQANRQLSPVEQQRYHDYIERRSQHEPVAYIIGYKEFWGMNFQVNPQVLIPRPETEILVAETLAEVRRRPPTALSIVDVGTGSGAIIVSLLKELPLVTMLGIDVSPEALNTTRYNVIILLSPEERKRLRLLHDDLLQFFVEYGEPVFDLIVSNPPYIAATDFGSLPADVRDYEPHQALHGGATGTEIIARLIEQARLLLKPQGALLLEIGSEQKSAVEALLNQGGFATHHFVNDLAGLPRCVIAYREKHA